MRNRVTITWILAAALVASLAAPSPAEAQSTLGGGKPQQNKIGGAAKPPTVVGGAAIHPPPPPTPPKPGPTVGMTKPLSPGAPNTIAPGATTNNSRSSPPVTTLNKGGTVANLKCANGACTSRGNKP